MRVRVRPFAGTTTITALALPVVLFLASCGSGRPRSDAPEPHFYPSPDPALRAFPLSEAVQVGDLLFVSGQVGSAPGTAGLVPGGIVPESRQALENIRAILGRHGSSLERVVKCTVFLADMKEWPAFNDVYRGFFPGRFPARSALGTNGLALGARVEVECFAFAPQLPK